MAKNILSYRPEIDGLRALAVISVLFYHLNVKFIGGGFAGVDVFFVISGFLITRIIINEVDDGSFSFLRFYERRVRRIGPALLTTLLVSSIVYLGWFSANENINFARQNLSALLSVSNIYFYKTIDYFNDSREAPSIHTWSLSVEEQFYVLFPVLIFAIGRYVPRRRLAILVALFGLSLTYSLYQTNVDRLGAFYLPIGRWWELLAGAILTCAAPKCPPKLGSWLSAFGLIGLLCSFLLLNDRMPFPGWIALLPVLSTVAVLACAPHNKYVSGFLSTPVLRWFGLISYSLYLVHWPIVCLAGNFIQTNGNRGILLISTLCIGLAWLSYRFVETPFRRPSALGSRAFLVRAAGVYCFAAAALTGTAALSAVFWNQYPMANRYFASDDKDLRDSTMRAGSCFLTSRYSNIDYFDQSKCLALSKDRKNILLMGDSHSAHFIHAFTHELTEYNFLQASASSCKPLPIAQKKSYCSDLVDYMYHSWLEKNSGSVDAVIISARWEESDGPLLENAKAWFKQRSIPLLILGPSPEYVAPLPRILAWGLVFAKPDLDHSFLKSDRFLIDKTLKSGGGLAGSYISLVDSLCGTTRSCRSTIDQEPMFFDRDHLSIEGSKYVVDMNRNVLTLLLR